MASSQPGRPNILFIMADQHRWDFMGASGEQNVCTPNLDRLAARGVRFANCFTNSPLCAPARGSLATGLLPHRLGMSDNMAYLRRGEVTYYQRLRDHDYRVGAIGKIDLAKPDPYNGRFGDRPSMFRFGFTHPEECEGKMHAGTSATPIGPYTSYLQERGLLELFYQDYRSRLPAQGHLDRSFRDSVLPAEAFEDTYIGRRAVQWLEEIPDDYPWHLFVSFVGPHDPYDPPAEYANRFRNAPVTAPIVDGLEGKPDWVRRRREEVSPERALTGRRQYTASLQAVDDQVGAILDALALRGRLDDTWIIYASDHGEMLGDHGLWQKHVAYEASIRIPLLISGPGVPAGRVSDALVELMDVNPTICSLAGLPLQENIDALPLNHLLQAPSEPHRPSIFTLERPFYCYRDEHYKLVSNHDGFMELYDLERDPHELQNVAPEQAGLVRGLNSRLRARMLDGKWLR